MRQERQPETNVVHVSTTQCVLTLTLAITLTLTLRRTLRADTETKRQCCCGKPVSFRFIGTMNALCQFLRGLAVVWPETFFYFVRCMCFYIFLHPFVRRIVS